MSFRKNFIFCDVHSHRLRQWKRIRIDEVKEKLIEPSKNYRCFQSIQLWEKPRHEEGELMWMPVFFDLDAKVLENALADLKKLTVYLDTILEISPEFVRVYFSGKKGFHVIIQPEIFDIEPHKDLHLKVRKLCMYLAELLDLKSFDSVVYSKRRLLRVYNSIHESTRLHKIELHHTDLGKGMDHILEKAKKPQNHDERPYEGDFYEDAGYSENAKNLWDEVTTQVEEARELSNLSPDRIIQDTGSFPVCVKHILKLNAQPKPNAGNRTVLSLAAYMRDAGKSEDECIGLLTEWASRQTNIGDAGKPESAAAMVKSTVRYVYRSDKEDSTYHFACKYMLSLGTSEEKIPCLQLRCPAIRGQMQKTKEVPKLELAEFSKSPYLGEKVEIKTLISGKAGTPFIVPKNVRFTCTPDEEKGYCTGCPVAAFNGEADFAFDVEDPEILEIINCTNSQQWAAIRRKFGFPKSCKNCKGRVQEYMNVEEVRMSPTAINVSEFKRMEFVARKGYFTGYPIQSNKRYTLVGYPVKEPKTQASAFLFRDKTKLETDVETFKLTDEIQEELKVFECKEGQTPDEKFRDIHIDLAVNVHRIKDRMELAWAMDLLAHSVRGFRFGKEPFVKGWMELLVVGDSGQGKTSMANRMIRDHYGVFEYISGSSAKRTGLLYSYQETGGSWMLIWGAIPLNDLGGVMIDEFGDLPEEQFALLTDVRSSGIVKAVGVVTAETYGRVRLMALTNPKKGKHLAEFDYPCMAIKQIVPAAEDIRRFDLACAVASGEVSVEKINSMEDEEIKHVYTSHLCSQLIRWAWSRTESQIRFDKEAIRKILSWATQMSKDFFAGEIPLVEPADQRFKIARLSAATAARLHSTDESGENLIVTTDHVDFAIGLMYYHYTNKSFRYHDWSRNQRRAEGVDDEDMSKVFDRIQEISKWKEILALLSIPGQIENRDFESVFENRAMAVSVANILRHIGIVERKWNKYFKTAKGNSLVKWAIDNKKVTSEEIDNALMGKGGDEPAPPETGAGW